MTKQLNHGAICGRIFAHMLNHPAKPKVSEQQEVILLDMLDGLTREDLRKYAGKADELVKLPLSPRDEQQLLLLSGALGLLTLGQAAAIAALVGGVGAADPRAGRGGELRHQEQ